MRRTTALLAIGGLTLLGCATASPAFATDSPPAYHALLWEVPGGESSLFEPDQILAGDVLTDEVSLDLLDGLMQCGTTYQYDFEHNSAITDALVTGGLLHGPNNPQEDHAYEAFPNANPWKVVTTPDCVQPADISTPGSSEAKDCATSTVTITNWHDVVSFTGDKYGYVASEPVRVADPDTTRATTALDCPVIGSSLASTGINPERAAALAALGALTIGLALIAIFWRRIATWMDGVWFRGAVVIA